MNSINYQDKYLRYPLVSLYLFGLWRKEHNPFLYYTYSFAVLFFTQYLYTITQIIYMVKVWGDIEKISEASFLLLTQLSLCIKVIIFVWKGHILKRLTVNMNDLVFSTNRPSHIKIINATSADQKSEYFIFLSIASFTNFLFAIFPLIDTSETKVLPFKAWYPLPDNKTPYYEILYVYQIACIWFSSLISPSIDRLVIGMTAHACAQTSILIDNILNIENYAKDDLEKKEEVESIKERCVDMGESSKVDSENKALLKQGIIDKMVRVNFVNCVQHHRYIVSFMRDVQECFTWGILAQLATGVGTICFTGLQITVINRSSFKFASKIIYFVAMMVERFFILQKGNELTELSKELCTAVYSSPWVERGKSFNKSLIIFMERLKRPIIIRAGYFFPLSLNTFLSILRSSYSYFAVLRQLNSK